MNNPIDLLIWAHLNSIRKLQDAALDYCVILIIGNNTWALNEWEELTKNYLGLSVYSRNTWFRFVLDCYFNFYILQVLYVMYNRKLNNVRKQIHINP